MKFVRQYVQETITEKTPEKFDVRMNAVFTKAGRAGKEPDVHYHERDGYSATVRYWIQTEIAETIAEEFELKGLGKKCFECPLYKLPDDKRIRYSYCDHSPTKISANDNACDYYYETYERRTSREVKTLPFHKKSVRSEQA